MEMYNELVKYFDNEKLSVLQEEWSQLKSHNYETGVCVEDLFEFWDKIYFHPDDNIIVEPEKVEFSNLIAPIKTEHFF